jgi:parvulin-like peptidyl-prolyl isomerase
MPLRLFTTSIAITLACVALAACGSSHAKTQSAGAGSSATSSSRSSTRDAAATSDSPIDPNDPALGEVLATVAHGQPITRAELLRWMEVGGASRKEGREPSSVLTCIDQMRNPQVKTPSELQGSCRKRFQGDMEAALSSLIHNQWLLGEAADRAIKVNQVELRIELEKNLGPAGSAMVKRLLAQTGQTLPEVKLNLELGQLSDRLYEETEAKVPKTGEARLEAYYAQHKQSYAVPLERDLHIIRFASNAAARKALGELRAGKSFASVVKEAPSDQPLGAKDGLLLGLSREAFKETTLADAIFRAKPGTLLGPVEISLGSYVFEVTRIHPPRQRTFAEVRAELRKVLPELLHKQTLAAATAAFKRKWIARTSCHAGWVVQNCREYKITKASEAYDAYTF